jgi:hypothetical protein
MDDAAEAAGSEPQRERSEDLLAASTVELRPATYLLFKLHLLVITLLLLAHLAAHYIVSTLNSKALTHAVSVFNLGYERTLANFFSATMLVFTAMASALVALRHRSQHKPLWLAWLFVTIMIGWLAIDEGAMLHDRLARIVQETLQTSGVFYVGWTLPYLLLVIAVAFVGLPLLRALPRRTRWRMIVAAALYVGAALGMEMIEGALLHGSVPEGTPLRSALDDYPMPPGYWELVTIEEVLEMVAVALALRSLLLHLVDDLGVTRVIFGSAAPDRAA